MKKRLYLLVFFLSVSISLIIAGCSDSVDTPVSPAVPLEESITSLSTGEISDRQDIAVEQTLDEKSVDVSKGETVYCQGHHHDRRETGAYLKDWPEFHTDTYNASIVLAPSIAQQSSENAESPISENAWDINGDGIINHWDITIVSNYFGQDMPVECFYNPDVNRDGRIDLIDLVLVAIHYGETFSTSANPSAGSDYIVYVTETGTKYHKVGCRYLKESAIPILKSEAIKKGYTPCSVCKP